MSELLDECIVRNSTLLAPLKNHGMHVKVSNIIEFVCPDVEVHAVRNHSLKVGVRFMIPMSLYIDIYELRRRHDWNVKSSKIDDIKISNYAYNSTMNNEIIAEHFNQSTELFVEFVVLSTENHFYFQYTIPLHLRYHLPSYTDSYKYVSLSSPSVYVNDTCQDQGGIGNTVTLSVPIGSMNDHVYVYSLSLMYYVSSVLIVLYVLCKSL